MTLTIRPACADETRAIVACYDWLFAPPGSRPPDWDLDAATERLQRAIAGDDAEVLVAELEGHLAGICTVYRDIESVRYGWRAWVEDLAVDPERRSLGIGKALLEAAKSWALRRGATHLELQSARARVDAHRFYERERPSRSAISFNWRLSKNEQMATEPGDE
jgi:GNAT superfamily N-acetyltransferase